ncbi:MAG: glycosyltransferase family 4 protein, partial [Rhodothermales bacterium]
AGLELDIFALRPPVDTHFQDAISRVRAPVHYLATLNKASDLWRALEAASEVIPEIWAAFPSARGEDVRDIYYAAQLARHVRRAGISHLHAHFATSATTVARLAAHFAGISYTFTAHAKDIFHESVQPDDLRRKLRDAAATITVSDYNTSYLHEHYGMAASRVRRIYNGLELSTFPYTAPDDRPPQIIAVGRLVEKKGFADLIDACALLARRGLRYTCQIIGSGLLEADLRARIVQLGLQDQVRMPGPRPQRDVIDHIRQAAVFAAPCVIGQDGNRDGLPTVLLEAMALGTPCISTDVTGIPEVLRDGETGLMVPRHHPEALADALERLLFDASLRTRLAGQARRLIEAEFDIHRNAARIRSVFETCRWTGDSVPRSRPVWGEVA